MAVDRNKGNGYARAFIGISEEKSRQGRVNSLRLASLNNSQQFEDLRMIWYVAWPWNDIGQGKYDFMSKSQIRRSLGPQTQDWLIHRRKGRAVFLWPESLFIFILFYFFMAAPMAYGNSWASIESKPELQPIPQLQQCQIFLPTVLGRGSNPHLCSYLSQATAFGFLTHFSTVRTPRKLFKVSVYHKTQKTKDIIHLLIYF